MVLPEDIKEKIAEMFKDLSKEIEVVVRVSPNTPKESIETAKELLEDISSSAGGKIKYEVLDYTEGFETNENVVFYPKVNERAQFYGIPYGLEFRTFLELLMLAGGLVKPEIPKCPEKELEIVIFVTPTCPYCPHAAMDALKMAFACPNIRTKIIEATQWPVLSSIEEVSAVPRYVIRDATGKTVDTWEGYGGLEFTLERLSSL